MPAMPATPVILSNPYGSCVSRGQDGVGRASAGMSCLALEGGSGEGGMKGEGGANAEEGGGADKPDKGSLSLIFCVCALFCFVCVRVFFVFFMKECFCGHVVL